MKRVHILISGKVTGVFFRRFIRVNAKKHDVKGWVRNVNDKVEAVFEGFNKIVDYLVELCKKGPEGSRIDNMKIKEEKWKDEFEDFEQR